MNDQNEICRRTLVGELIALGLALIGVAVRCLPWAQVFVGGEVVMPDTDNYYHLRRAWNLVTHFPNLPFFDPFISFPHGAPVPWPIGFDLLVALPSLLGANQETMVLWAAVLPPVLGGVAVLLTYYLGKRVFDSPTGVVAAGLVALMQGAANFSLLGRVDHHALVAPVTLGMYLSLLAALETQRWRRRLVWSLAVGVLAAVAASSWIITPALYFVPVPVTLFVLRFCTTRVSAKPVVWIGLGSAVLFVGLGVVLFAPSVQSAFTLYQLSWVQVLPLAVVLILVALAYYRLWLFLVCALVLVLGGPLLLWSSPSLINSLDTVLGVAAGKDPSYLLAGESAPLLTDRSFFAISGAAGLYTPLIFLFPFLLLLFVWRTIQLKNLSPPRVLVATFALLGGLLLFLQNRFGEYAAPAVALIFAWAIISGGRSLIKYVREAGRRGRRWILAAMLIASLGVAFLPVAKGLFRLADSAENYLAKGHELRFARALSLLLPPAAALDGRPAYALLSGWDDAHLLLWATGRAVAVSSFATPEALMGNQTAFRLLLSNDEERFVREADQTQVRMIVVSPIFKQMQNMAVMAGFKEDFMSNSLRTIGDNLFMYYEPLAPFWDTIHTRLFLGDGTARSIQDHSLQPLSHIRLILESEDTETFLGQSTAEFKAFEVVGGARLVGEANPGEKVFLRLTIQTNVGRTFLYERETVVDPSGHFSLVVPYDTNSAAPVHSVGPYRLKIAGRVIHLDVTDEAVRNLHEVPIVSGKPFTGGGGE